MKQSKQHLTLLLLLTCSVFYAQNNQQLSNQDYVEFNDRKNVVHGVYLGLTMHYGEIKNQDTYFAGLKVAYVANQQFEIGFAGNFFYSDQNILDASTLKFQDLIGGYGGLHLEPILFSKSRVNLSFPLLIGGGGMGYIDDDFDEDTFDEKAFENNSQAFLLVEPGVNLLFNVSRYLQLEAGVRYRFSDNINGHSNFTPIKRINGFSGGIGIKVGVFNMGRNRYKKNI